MALRSLRTGSAFLSPTAGSNDLSVIDTQLMRVLVTVPVGKMPFRRCREPGWEACLCGQHRSRNVSYFIASRRDLEQPRITPDNLHADCGPTDISGAVTTVYVINELSNPA